MSRPNLTAKNGSDCGHTDATSTLCFDVSHFWTETEKKNWSKKKVSLDERGDRSGFPPARSSSYLVEGQDPLHLLQALLRDLQALLFRHTAVAG